MKVIAHCNTPFEAQLVKGSLEAGGFHPVVFNRMQNDVWPGIALGRNGDIDVRVPAEEYEKAVAWLAAQPNSVQESDWTEPAE